MCHLTLLKQNGRIKGQLEPEHLSAHPFPSLRGRLSLRLPPQRSCVQTDSSAKGTCLPFLLCFVLGALLDSISPPTCRAVADPGQRLLPLIGRDFWSALGRHSLLRKEVWAAPGAPSGGTMCGLPPGTWPHRGRAVPPAWAGQSGQGPPGLL